MRNSILLFCCFLWVTLVGCGPPTGQELGEVGEFQGLLDESWTFQLEEDPLLATWVGVHDFDDQLPSMAIEDIERRREFWEQVLDRLEAIDRESLTEQDRINYDMFERQVSDRASLYAYRDYLIPITAESGFHTSFARQPAGLPMATTTDYENFIARMEAYPLYSEQNIALMREGMRTGMVLPQVVLEGYETTINPHLVDDITESVFWVPFESFPTTVPQSDHEGLRQAGRVAIRDSVIPAYQTFFDFMVQEYIPGARTTIGASELPNGKEYYEFLVRHHTTLDVTPEQVHEIGLSEVERIRGEMMAIIEGLESAGEFEGDFDDFLEFLRTDRRFFPTSGEQLLKEASFISKKMDGKLPALFKTLPRQPYGVAPVPAHIAPKYTAGRYSGAPIDGTKAGFYWVNTYGLESRPLWALTALTLHEAVPGHHLQNALRQELTDLPNFRRYSGINAYGEGWGLYSEWLGIEAGMYDNPYDDFGRLSYEAWRACRLVVDTGMHAMGWSRQQAMNYMTANTALSLHEITTETDRYISWPGQALAYKMGQIKIQELRRRAESRLGSNFNVREFHDVILLDGPVPLTVLEDQIEAFIERSNGGPPAS